MLRKHARGRIFLVKITREKSMPRTKPLFDASRLAPFARLHEIDRSAPRRAGFTSDEAPRILSQADSAPPSKMPAAAETSRLMFKVISCSAESAPALLFAIVSWLVAEAQAGFAAYAMAMHPTPAATDDLAKPGDPEPSPPASADRKPRLRMISTDMEHDDSERHVRRLPSEPVRIRASTCVPADDMMQPTQTNRIIVSWYAAIGTLAVALLSKLRQARARRQAIAELQSLDDRSLRDIGICRGEIQNATRCE
jgi:uncharacterized protein YjiS (DUF1127 family)